jgi:Leucine-rich repeat (LRR) protein
MAFAELTELRHLDLSYNRLTLISNDSFTGIVKLDFLSLSGNPLIELADGCFIGLTVSRLELVNNSLLSRISPSAFSNSRVTSLLVNRCSLDVVDRASLKHLAPSLHELTIVNNLRPLTVSVDALHGFRLHHLTLTNNSLTDASFLTSASGGDHNEINLDDNRDLWSSSAGRKRLPADGGSERNAGGGCSMKTTRRLSLSGTSIGKLSDVVNISIFSELEELNLSRNIITELDSSEFLALHRLTILDLSDNVINRYIVWL